MDPISGNGSRGQSQARPPALRVEQLTKRFPGQTALRGVSLGIDPRRVHALVGHNGSGKSTLIKVLAGLHRPDHDSGPITVDGQRLKPGDPEASRRAGLRFIHQELGLIDGLSVLENLALGSTYETGFAWHLRRTRERQEAVRLLETFGVDVRPETLLRDLTAVQRTGVAIARALRRGPAHVAVFDEPTATLPDREVAKLFETIRNTVTHGASILYVSHRLEELYEIADDVTVLRDGEVVGSEPIAEFSRVSLVDLVVGTGGRAQRGVRPRSQPVLTEGARGSGTERLTFDRVDAGVLRAAAFRVDRGEIVGVAGLAGSGVHDIPQALLGEVRVRSGSIRIDGEVLQHRTPWALVERGVAVVPSARVQKYIPTMSVRENLTLPNPREAFRRGWLRVASERSIAQRLIERFKVRPEDTERPLATLSGGNQQKVCVAKWLHQEPRLLVLDEPTAGIDVGGRAEVLNILRGAAQRGVGILICSSDLEDLAELCTRVLVIRDGAVAAELQGERATRERITHECYRSSHDIE